ncbi:uncharacterized protein LOC132204983 [Neocloeon triangulifer]|uniref:uncharacterized protein LOC132202900 n=1 Tax=Neocloeon triangulifer TaxID=2078957 RepID=UPI00286EB870|nr:uncharacterized protein LOC132202900 [Neocloeon triangulifer]XP_059489764.1 uncharacterized protein LOC132204983 [Neocloeon triangulifer]
MAMQKAMAISPNSILNEIEIFDNESPLLSANEPVHYLKATVVDQVTKEEFIVNANIAIRKEDRVLFKSGVEATFPGNVVRTVRIIGLGETGSLSEAMAKTVHTRNAGRPNPSNKEDTFNHSGKTAELVLPNRPARRRRGRPSVKRNILQEKSTRAAAPATSRIAALNEVESVTQQKSNQKKAPSPIRIDEMMNEHNSPNQIITLQENRSPIPNHSSTVSQSQSMYCNTNQHYYNQQNNCVQQGFGEYSTLANTSSFAQPNLGPAYNQQQQPHFNYSGAYGRRSPLTIVQNTGMIGQNNHCTSTSPPTYYHQTSPYGQNRNSSEISGNSPQNSFSSPNSQNTLNSQNSPSSDQWKIAAGFPTVCSRKIQRLVLSKTRQIHEYQKAQEANKKIQCSTSSERDENNEIDGEEQETENSQDPEGRNRKRARNEYTKTNPLAAGLKLFMILYFGKQFIMEHNYDGKGKIGSTGLSPVEKEAVQAMKYYMQHVGKTEKIPFTERDLKEGHNFNKCSANLRVAKKRAEGKGFTYDIPDDYYLKQFQ